MPKENQVKEQPLVVSEMEKLNEKELVITKPEESTELTVQAENVLEEVIVAFNEYQDTNTIITSIGSTELNEIGEISKVLDAPVKNIMGEKNSPQDNIATSLIEIKVQADTINPGNFDLNPGFFGRMLGKITGNTAINKYATQYTSTKDIIESISKSLDHGILELKEDNGIFEQDKARFRKASNSLKAQIQLLMAMSETVEKRIETVESEEEKNFLQEEVLFTLNSHTIDLQQTHMASLQGVAAINLLIKNNRELIRGVERTKRAVIPVMSIGFTIATGLATQKKILDLTENINKAASETMLQNSKMLKEQGVQIQKQASNAMLDIDKITESMNLLVEAIDDVENYKKEALPGMKESIAQLSNLSDIVDRKVNKMEQGEKYIKAQKEKLKSLES